MAKSVLVDKVYDVNTIGYPCSPTRWTSEPTYKTVTRILMSCGGGMGGSRWYEIVEKLTDAKIEKCMESNKPLVVTTYDGKKKTINLRYMVMSEPLTLLERNYYTTNDYYGVGEHTYKVLLPFGRKVRFSEKYISLD